MYMLDSRHYPQISGLSMFMFYTIKPCSDPALCFFFRNDNIKVVYLEVTGKQSCRERLGRDVSGGVTLSNVAQATEPVGYEQEKRNILVLQVGRN
jgi:hypothetical protein